MLSLSNSPLTKKADDNDYRLLERIFNIQTEVNEVSIV